MSVHTTLAMPLRTSPRAACDGLVVSEGRISKSQIIHGALRCCTSFKGFEDYVSNTRTYLYVSTNYSSCFWRIKERPLWDQNLNGVKTTLVKRDFAVYQTSETVNDGTACDWPGSITVAIGLWVCACEVKESFSLCSIYCQFQIDYTAIIHVVWCLHCYCLGFRCMRIFRQMFGD